jgi:hypothetical protein
VNYHPHVKLGMSFYLPHMEYEGSIGLVTGKMKKKNITDFHVLVLLLAKKHDLSDNFFSVCHAQLPAVAVRMNFHHAYSLPPKS